MVYMQIVSYKDAYIVFNELKFLSNRFRPEFFSLPLGLPYNLTALLHIVSLVLIVLIILELKLINAHL